MSNNKIFREVGNLLNEIVQKNKSLEKEGENISQIELDIIKSEIRDLYQLYNHLSVINSQQPTVDRPLTTDNKPQQAITSDERKAKSEKENKELIENKKTVVIEEPREEIITQSIKLEELETEIKERVKITSDLFTSSETTTTISEKFRDDKKSINDSIGLKKSDRNIADKLKTKHTDDIKTLIGINEKFLFINELFEGSMNEYNEFIAKLNNFNNLNEAISFINEQKSLKKWKDDMDSLGKLSELIESRY